MKSQIHAFTSAFLILGFQFSCWAGESVETRIDQALSQMTLEEKVGQINLGKPAMYLGQAVPRLGIPPTLAADGPRGPNSGEGQTRVCYPVALAYAASWDPALVEQVGVAFGKQLIESGRNQLYAPGVNMIRHPLAGRNAEYLGEDPFLSGRIAAAECRGIQSTGCVATVKHLICNDFETGRTHLNVDVPERPLREIYLRPFEIAIKEGNPLSIMTSYNSINGHFAAANAQILQTLRKDCGFKGFVVSDYGCNMEGTAAALNAGCNQELSGWKSFKLENVKQALADGSLKPETLDQRVREILRVKFTPGFYDGSKSKEPVNQEAKRDLAMRVGAESMVLLKNKGGLLPIKAAQTIALIGPFADGEDLLGDYNGSASIRPERVVTLREELQRRCGGRLTYARGCGAVELGDGNAQTAFPCKAEYFDNLKLEGKPVLVREEASIQKVSFKGQGAAKLCDGVLGKALSFGGQSAWQAGTFPGRAAKDDFTIAFWVALDGAFLNDKPFLAGQSAMQDSFKISGMGVEFRNRNTGKSAQLKTQMQLQKWTHMALERKDGKLKLWIAGASAGETAMDFPLAAMPLLLGGNPSRNQFAQARIDDLRAFSRALSPEEIARLAAKEAIDNEMILHAACDEAPAEAQADTYPGITNPMAMSARWTGKFTPQKTGRHAFQVLTNGGVRLFLDGKCLMDLCGENNDMYLWPELEAGRTYEVKIEYSMQARAIWNSQTVRFNWYEPELQDQFAEAKAAAKGKDVAVVVVGVQQSLLQGEANDNEWFGLPGRQQELIKAVESVNPNTVVVLCSSGGVDMQPWLASTPAVLEAFYPGQEGGRSRKGLHRFHGDSPRVGWGQ